jgi:hypothetical protein
VTVLEDSVRHVTVVANTLPLETMLENHKAPFARRWRCPI